MKVMYLIVKKVFIRENSSTGKYPSTLIPLFVFKEILLKKGKDIQTESKVFCR